MNGTSGRMLVLGCGALANELRAALRQAKLASEVDVAFLPPALHNRPEEIPDAVRTYLTTPGDDGTATPLLRYGTVLLGYADCGTAGALDDLCDELNLVRLPGAHCYELLAGTDTFEQLCADEPATFFLTDFLARNFERLVWRGLGMETYPHLRDAYFGNYRRVALVGQRTDPEAQQRNVAAAERAADLLGLPLTVHHVGHEPISSALVAVAA